MYTQPFDIPPEYNGDSIGMYYDRDNNIFVDEDGFPIYEIFTMITPNDLYLFKKKKCYMIVNHKTLKNVVCELYWLDDDSDYETMDINDDGERADRYEKGKWRMCFD
jgi:hypothetical protein